MAGTIVRELGGTKSTITNRKTIAHQPSSERVQIRPGTIPAKKY
jgi:hypothetical protein